MPIAAQQSTAALNLPYIMPAQALSYITHNEALQSLDVRVQTRVESRSLDTPPDAPTHGETFIVPDPQGAWTSPPGTVMRYEDGTFLAYPPVAGWLVWVTEEQIYLGYDGVAWQALHLQGPDLEALDELGVNATADPVNRFTVASEAVLFNHDGGSHRCVVNKASSEETASFLFQNDFLGHAEFGLIGDNRFALKTSGNGVNFNDVFRVDPWTANLRLPDGRQLEFDVDSGNKTGVSYIRTRQGNMSFEKPTSDNTLSEGTAFVFNGCGGQTTGNPFWQGLQITGTIVSRDGSNVLPRASLHWKYTNKDDPDDLTFLFKTTGSGLNADIAFEPAGEGVLIADTQTGMRIGPDVEPVEAMLDVQGAIRMRTYTIAALPTDQGSGSVAMISDGVDGLAMVFFDGAVWRTIHDRQTVQP